MHYCPRRPADRWRAHPVGPPHHHRTWRQPADARTTRFCRTRPCFAPLGFAGHGCAVVPRPLTAHGETPPCDRLWRHRRPRPPQLTPRTV